MTELTKVSALELSRRIKAKEISVAEVVIEQLKVIKHREREYHCYTSVLEEEAYMQAKEVQQRINAGELKDSPLAGVPVSIKDNICTKGIRTTCASKMLHDFIPTYDATVIEKLKQAGVILIGKANLDEFAMGGTTESSYYGPTKNPWDPTRSPGGSSGGSAAGVAAEEAFLSLGSDTGGSIRKPAGYCGVTGIKPTYGTVSRYGLIAYASSLDQIGPLGRNISDSVAALEVISGHDPKDSTSALQKSYPYTKALVDDVKGLRIGIPRGYLGQDLQEEVKKGVLDVAAYFTQQGAHVEEFDLDNIDYAVPSYYVIACAEASSNLARFDGVKYGYRTESFDGLQSMYKNTREEGFGYEVKRRMLMGALVLSAEYYEAYYNKAMKVRRVISQSFQKAFESYDILMGPATPETASKLGSTMNDSSKIYQNDVYTVAVNLAGLPALCMPCGLDSQGLPIGIQLIGKHYREADIIRAAYSLEQSRSYERPTPLVLEEKEGVWA